MGREGKSRAAIRSQREPAWPDGLLGSELVRLSLRRVRAHAKTPPALRHCVSGNSGELELF